MNKLRTHERMCTLGPDKSVITNIYTSVQNTRIVYPLAYERFIYSHVCKRHVRGEGTSQRHKSTCDALMLLNLIKNRGTLDLKGTKLNVLIRDKISVVGVALLTSGSRSCSWALYHFPPCTIVGSYRDSIGQTNKNIKNCENMKGKKIINKK